MPETPVDTRFAFQPLINLHTGGVVAMEMLARPMQRDVQSLLRSTAQAGRLESLDVTFAVASQAVLEINPSHAALKPALLLAGVFRLRRLGYRIALDGVGAGNYPLTVIAEARPDLIKMDREIGRRSSSPGWATSPS